MNEQLLAEHREKIGATLSDLKHIAKETEPNCDDDQLRRVSVQLRRLLIENDYVECWKLLRMEPKHPTIVAPRLRTEGLRATDFAVAAGGNITGTHIALATLMPGHAAGPEEVKRLFEQGKTDIAHPFPAAQYLDSCALFVSGMNIKRRQTIQYIAHKKGGAHWDNRRRKDEEAYVALDQATTSGLVYGGPPGGKSEDRRPGKNAVFLELLSIGQSLVQSPDTQRFMKTATDALKA